jgi:ABC-type uncharacterized transport system involved in gliding motility auxiliary subunit
LALGSARARLEAILFVLALVLALLAGFGPWDQDVANTIYFGAWCSALFLLFSLGLRLPLYLRGRYARPAGAAIVVTAIALGFFANIVLYRRDANFDVTIEGRYTAPTELQTVVGGLDRDVAVTYFYNSQDPDALAVTDVLTAVARRDRHLRVRAFDLDKELIAARDYGVRLYNTAIVESGGRRTTADATTDLRDVAFAIERVLKQRTSTVCFVIGHGETYGAAGSHVHLGHTETLGGAFATLQAPPAGVDRLQLAIEAIGYSDHSLTLPTASDIPADCAVVADIAPLSAYSPDEVRVLRDYLVRGGRLLLMYDPQFPVTVTLQELLGEVGLEVGEGIVVDPTNHSGTEQDNVAVPYYQQHPITDQLALTVFPAPRPIVLLRQAPKVKATTLVTTSKDSYVRAGPTAASAVASTQLVVGSVHGNSAGAHGPTTLAVALQGSWPQDGEVQFRLVLIGSASFAANAFFPYASNGDLAVSTVRWLAGDTGTPKLKPMTYAAPEVQLTHREMQVTFVVVELLLPLSVILCGIAVWRWRR